MSEGAESIPVESQGAPEPSAFEPITSQDEFDKRLAARLQRERSKFADYDDLKSKVANLDKITADARSEGEKSASEKLSSKLFEAEVKAAATSLGFHDPADALAQFGSRDGTMKGLDIDSEALSKRLTEIAEAKPYLVKGESGPKVALKPKIAGNPDKKSGQEAPKGSKAAAALRAFSSSR